MVKKSEIVFCSIRIPVYSVNTLVVGSGAASLNCADHLFSFGIRDILIATEKFGGGASNLSGSDKQTYYKLSLAGSEPDSVYEMANTLFVGGAMHGDIAIVEAGLSAQEFFHLVSIGVEFPHNVYGGFTGYKTDHDPQERATSAGPRTSNQMVRRLAEQLRIKGIPILDYHEVVSLLTVGEGVEKRVVGALAVNKMEMEQSNFGLVIFDCENIVWGVGGPGGMYQTSVYPEGQIGSIGVALEIGAIAQNLTESQYGLSSTKFRWNVSGTYQQVIPNYFSTDQKGSDRRSFLNRYFPSMGKLASDIFLKGYQWPFDARKVTDYGSSLIDLLAYRERVMLGRRVFLDFTQNPEPSDGLEEFRFQDLDPEAYRYLDSSGALLATPIERLEKMNPLAIELYKSQNIDVTREPLEIAVCSQHNNGGLKGNIWWESNIKHLFPIGEVNGAHGIYRPGGASLNSGQVGGYRAAQRISARYNSGTRGLGEFVKNVSGQIEKKVTHFQDLLRGIDPQSRVGEDIKAEIQTRMTMAGSHIRERGTVLEELRKGYDLWERIKRGVPIRNRVEVLRAIQNELLCLTHIAYLESIREYLESAGGSRGSYLVMDREGEAVSAELGDDWRFKAENPELRHKICELQLGEDEKFRLRWVSVRPIPEDNFWFENVWRDYRKGKVFE
jgi:succinate dehydrogenase/fumarate reductase flavoprotein subunit